jgi:hypothetical protein
MTQPAIRWRDAGWALGIALAIRLAALGIWMEDLDRDPDAYRALAQGWAQSGTFGLIDQNGVTRPTAYRPPMYPWVLSWLVSHGALSPTVVGLLHVVLGMVTAVLVFDIATRLAPKNVKSGTCSDSRSPSNPNGQSWGPLLAVVLFAVDPILVRQSTLVMTETLATLMAVGVWWLWMRTQDSQRLEDKQHRDWRHLSGALALGVCLGLNALCRPTGIVWGCLMALHGPWGLGYRRWQRHAAWSSALLLGMLLVVSPWAIRNRVQMGKPIWMTTHGGYTLLLANNPWFYEHLRRHGGSRTWDAGEFHRRWQERYTRGLDPAVVRDALAPEWPGFPPPAATELTDDAFANRMAWATIAEQPGIFLASGLVRVAWLWAWWPGPDGGGAAIRMVTAFWYGAIFMGVGWGCMKGCRGNVEARAWSPMLLLALSLTMVHALYWSNMRMRAPLMPAMHVAFSWTLIRALQSRRSA